MRKRPRCRVMEGKGCGEDERKMKSQGGGQIKVTNKGA